MAESREILWAHVLEAWDEDKRHSAFLAYCTERGDLSFAAQKYREIAEASAEGEYRELANRRLDAKKRLSGVAILALATLEATKKEPTTGRTMLVLRVLAGLFLLAALVALAFALSGG